MKEILQYGLHDVCVLVSLAHTHKSQTLAGTSGRARSTMCSRTQPSAVGGPSYVVQSFFHYASLIGHHQRATGKIKSELLEATTKERKKTSTYRTCFPSLKSEGEREPSSFLEQSSSLFVQTIKKVSANAYLSTNRKRRTRL